MSKIITLSLNKYLFEELEKLKLKNRSEYISGAIMAFINQNKK